MRKKVNGRVVVSSEAEDKDWERQLKEDAKSFKKEQEAKDLTKATALDDLDVLLNKLSMERDQFYSAIKALG
jgi:hypothetical protein